jgi:hypothetical protein
LSAESRDPNPKLNTAEHDTKITNDDVVASAPSARDTSAAPEITKAPTVSFDKRGPVTALATTDAATPTARKIPRALTGSWRLIRADGHKSPRVEPGKATPR